MLSPALPLLRKARAKKYAIPAFNINNLEILKAVVAAAEAERSPVIIQTSEGAIAYAGMAYLVAMVRVAAQGKIPVVLHLDHGKDLALIKRAIASGYSSVMFDGSLLPYRENVKHTRKVVAWAHAKKISVEAELGVLKGREDFVDPNDADAALTDPQQAGSFWKETGCDTLAVAIGTSHGAYKFPAKTHLDIPRLRNIAAEVSAPLVLHGASGVRENLVELARRHGAKLGEMRGVLDADITQAIKMGVAKINIDTDLRLAFTAGVREAVDRAPDIIDPREVLEPAMTLMRDVATRKIRLFGSAGRL